MHCRPLNAFGTWYALVSLMVAASPGVHGEEDPSDKPQCKTPQKPFYEILNNTDFRFIFNETSKLCEEVFIDPTFRNYTFDSRFKCVSQCNTGQGAPFCAQQPWNACNESTISDDYEISYFYNVSSRKCEEYQDCGGYFQAKETDVNGFYDRINCEYQCQGFSQADVCGSNRSERTE
ncbi:uncharacterized protein LOC144135239 [Amblyomma americanum]